jgi:hypothetical protein
MQIIVFEHCKLYKIHPKDLVFSTLLLHFMAMFQLIQRAMSRTALTAQFLIKPFHLGSWFLSQEYRIFGAPSKNHSSCCNKRLIQAPHECRPTGLLHRKHCQCFFYHLYIIYNYYSVAFVRKQTIPTELLRTEGVAWSVQWILTAVF